MFCSKPWTDLELMARGATTCCTAWLRRDAYVHDSDEEDPWSLWNADPIMRLRLAVKQDDRRYCQNCPWLASGTTPKRTDVDTDRIDLDRGPRSLADCVDRTCNLHCWSCRREPVPRPANWEELALRIELALTEFGPFLELYSTNQIGDAFASPVSRKVLCGHWLACSTDCKIRICTNGLLMPFMWPRVPDQTRDRLQAVHISIDAATRDTYEQLRRGGSWDALLEALNYLALLRRPGQPGRPQALLYQFVVQSANFREMPAFVDLAKAGRATKVVFTHLRRFGLTREEFAGHSLANPDHPDRPAFVDMLQIDPDLRDPIVDRRHLNPRVAQSIWKADGSRP